MKSSSKNMFDQLLALSAPKPSDLHDELKRYLSSDPEHVVDVLSWWFERWHMYPRLSTATIKLPENNLYRYVDKILSKV